MHTCKTCDREFNNTTSLITHLTHNKSKCKTKIKDYYDKFHRKENEGYCKFCGKETGFASLVEGYPRDVCKYCKNKNPETQRLRKETFKKNKEKRKKESGYYDLPEFCEICKKENKNVRFKTRAGLSRHSLHIHNVQPKEYYDKYLKNPGEGTCPITGKGTKFKNLREGYFIYSGKGVCSADSKIQKKKEETLLKNYGVKNASQANEEKRIKKYKNTIKKRTDLQYERFRLIYLLQKASIDRNNKSQCQICGWKKEGNQLTLHLKIHNITTKEYYDKYFKKDNEGICPLSGLKTNFDCFERGYFKYHPSMTHHTPEIKKAAKKYQLQYIKKVISENQNNYNVEFINLESLNKIGDLTDIKCLNCQEIYKNRYTNLVIGYGKCPKCFPRNTYTSTGQKELYDFVSSVLLDKEILQNYKGIVISKNGRSLDLDIYIPELNVAIEYDGLYWHSELVLEDPIHYHIYKTNECSKKGIRLIHIFEDEWYYKKEIIKSIIENILKTDNRKRVHARKCKIKEIDPSTKNNFLDAYHIQGKDYSKIKIGAFYNNELVSVMTFGNGNISRGGNPNDKTKWELSRFCTGFEYRIPGIASKMLTYFKRNYIWKEIYSYADFRWSIGNLYYKLGFSLEHLTLPDYWYVSQTKRIHRFKLRKSPDEPKEITEETLRSIEGYYRIYDCGKLKFTLTNKDDLFCSDFHKKIKNEQKNLDPISKQTLEKNCILHYIDYNENNKSRENLIFLNQLICLMVNSSNKDHWKIILTDINNQTLKN